MGKIVKYCNTCEESFAEKFSFCPICGDPINAFEMNPIAEAANAPVVFPEEVIADEIIPEEIGELVNAKSTDVILNPLDLKSSADAVPVAKADLPATDELLAEDQATEFELSDVALELDEEDAIDVIEPVAKPKYAVLGPDSGFGSDRSDEAYKTTIDYSNFQPIDSNSNNFVSGGNDDFRVTVLTEKNVKERNMLLLGTMVIVLTLCFGVVIASIFNHPLLVGAIGGDDLIAFVPIVEDVPMTVEEEQKKKDDKDGGGGGGGGRDEQTPTSKGRLANQTPNPLINPDVSIIQRRAELQQPVASTQGDRLQTPTDERYGDPNSTLAKLSNGLGTGGGQGSGVGTGQGSGRGTGQGSGIGSGSGSGIGDGTGPGSGRGTGGGSDEQPPTRPAGPTKSAVIISKPQPKYTDAARINNIQGNVVLKITFLANGQIGSISAVSGLSYGLTEQAIAAARQITFEPAVRNGQPYSVTKTVHYRFAIY